jgi:vacuolar-type H+-ATPase subunit H
MSSGLSPFLAGLFAVGLLLTLIWLASATYRRVEWFRLKRRSRPDGKETSEIWIDRPRVYDEKLGERSSPTADADVAGLPAPRVEAGRITDNARRAREPLEETALDAKTVVAAGPEHTARQASELDLAALEQKRMRLDGLAAIQEAERKAERLLLGADRQCANLLREAEAEAHRRASQITEDARQRVREQLEEAEREARAIVVDTANERALLMTELERERMRLEVERSKLAMPSPLETATQQVEELLLAAERTREELLRESEAEATRKASEIADVAHRQAEAVLERAELEAATIVAAADQEHSELAQMLARERSVQEDTRTRLSAFLAAMLAEVEGAAPDTREGQANVRDLDEIRAVRKSAAADS